MRHKVRKLVCRCQSQDGVGLRLHRRHIPAVMMQPGHPVPGHRQTIGMGQLLRQGQGLLTPPHGLRGIAQAPQRVGRDGQAMHPKRLTLAFRQGPLHRRVGEGDPLLEVRPSGGVFAQVAQDDPERIVGLQEVRRCGRALRQSQELFAQLSRRWQCSQVLIEPT